MHPFLNRAVSGNGARALAFASVVSVLVIGCSRTPSGSAVQTASPEPGRQALSQGLSVSCAAGQKAVMRQQFVEGQPVLDVQCVAVEPGHVPTAATASPGIAPVPVAVASQVGSSPGLAAEGPSSADSVVAQARRPGLARTVSYRDDGGLLTYEPRAARRVKSGRSWQKSAVIIGSSAGVGAGIGAALGGKKGALIGAALGGGGATIWDQASRRR